MIPIKTNIYLCTPTGMQSIYQQCTYVNICHKDVVAYSKITMPITKNIDMYNYTFYLKKTKTLPIPQQWLFFHRWCLWMV